ncbi:MinD/ParA family protein [Thalassobacillus pellis]|uniref:MinD/ParA family protein n=1 Tax=Thalassobacillus pellis TaxID=748008 RepID=UPI00195FFF7D|nr:MinD/ParA family protein [Thalassobacillus pellis]MBM7552731.1 flagellar biosynthesis protein FlhG [Thalassobacillus pellis]
MHDQAQALRDRLHNKAQAATAKTIAISSGKGGVGKSNIALNFCLALTEEKKRVLLIDLDIGMGNIDILIGKTSTYNFTDIFSRNLPIRDIIELGPKTLSYIAGGSGMSDIFHMDEPQFNIFMNQFEQMVTEYDYIVFDLGAGATEEGLHFIQAVDEAMIITTPEPTSMTDAYAMIKHIYRVQKNLKIYILVNRALTSGDGKRSIDRLEKVVRQFLNKDVHPLGILPDDRGVPQAVKEQVPFLLHDEQSPAAKSIRMITRQYLDESIDLDRKPSFRFLSKLKRLLAER